MRNVLFVVSHLFSGSDNLIDSLNLNERIDIKKPQLTYDHPEILEQLFSLGHKLRNSAAVYGDQLLFNKDFSNKSFYDFCKFIYFIRSPRYSISRIIHEYKNINFLSAQRYYCFRLRRMYEMALKTPGAVFLTYDEFTDKKGMYLIEKYLNLNQPVQFLSTDLPANDIHIPYNILTEAQNCYEKYYYCFKNINLLKL